MALFYDTVDEYYDDDGYLNVNGYRLEPPVYDCGHAHVDYFPSDCDDHPHVAFDDSYHHEYQEYPDWALQQPMQAPSQMASAQHNPAHSEAFGGTHNAEGYDNKFVDNVDDYQCTFCLLVPRDPKLLIGCGHSFCGSCLNQWIQKSNKPVKCPVDNTPFNISAAVPDKRLARVIGDLRVYCDNSELGCNVTPELRDFEEHMVKCTVQPIKSDMGEKEIKDLRAKFNEVNEIVIKLKAESVELKKKSIKQEEMITDLKKDMKKMADNNEQNVQKLNTQLMAQMKITETQAATLEYLKTQISSLKDVHGSIETGKGDHGRGDEAVGGGQKVGQGVQKGASVQLVDGAQREGGAQRRGVEAWTPWRPGVGGSSNRWGGSLDAERGGPPMVGPRMVGPGVTLRRGLVVRGGQRRDGPPGGDAWGQGGSRGRDYGGAGKGGEGGTGRGGQMRGFGRGNRGYRRGGPDRFRMDEHGGYPRWAEDW